MKVSKGRRKATQETLSLAFQPSLRDYSSSISRPRIASSADFSHPFGTVVAFPQPLQDRPVFSSAGIANSTLKQPVVAPRQRETISIVKLQSEIALSCPYEETVWFHRMASPRDPGTH
jgi:hypothetical protein